MKMFFSILVLVSLSISVSATDYHVGPAQSLAHISEVPWASLQAGDRVYIHWKSTAYKEKWVINGKGTEGNRIEIIGVNGPSGEKAVIDGNGAVTPANLNYWNEDRGVIKVGGSSVPSDGLPEYITIENLEIKSGHQDNTFTDSNGNTQTYTKNAASLYIEKGAHIIIKNCTLHSSGNGLFIGEFGGMTEDILIESNHFYDNGVEGSGFQHNSYTSAINIVFQYNFFGPLTDGADGNSLKDRSAGLVVRYNWINGGNRQLDLVDATNKEALINHPTYNTTVVYGNVLIENEDDGNSQMIHYGGDSGSTDDYRKGDLYLYNNTIISYRSGFTTLIRISTEDETIHVLNNVIYTTSAGSNFAMLKGFGNMNLYHNWIKTGWKDCHCNASSIITNLGGNIVGDSPLFEDFSLQDFRPKSNSPLLNQSEMIPLDLSEYLVDKEYKKEASYTERPISGILDIGAYEYDEMLHINSIDISKISIHPNPVRNRFYINCTNCKRKDVFIYSVTGQLISEIIGHEGNEIDVSPLEKGIYFIKVFTDADVLVGEFLKI